VTFKSLPYHLTKGDINLIAHNYIDSIPLHCINTAAQEYHVPAKLIIAVLNVERGRVGLAQPNKNGSYDLGPMQINTSWWPKLYNYGITPNQVRYNACINIRVATWILGKSIANNPDLLRGIGNYHSHTTALNHTYTQQVRVTYTQLSKILS
jgi:soluble lytic murein transglycosylase-like protein